jgi:hypothetical protein
MSAVMFAVLLVQRPGSIRRDSDTTSSWRGAEEVRPLSAAARANAWVSTIRWTLVALGVMTVVLFPVVLGVDYVIKGTALMVFAVIGMSLVVLTGWAGQISLGQMGIVGLGAAVSATCTLRWNLDLTLGLALGGLVGAVAAFAVGIPAVAAPNLVAQSTTISSLANYGTGNHALRVEVTQTDVPSLSAGGVFASLANTLTANLLVASPGVTSVSITNYADALNVAFARVQQLATATFTAPGNNASPVIITNLSLPNTLFSETIVINAIFNAAGAAVNASSQIVAVPEPA